MKIVLKGIKMKKTILIVEDNPLNINLLIAYLKNDYELLTAGSGEEALVSLENNKPDLILLDFMLPGINGFETCIKIKENEDTFDIPIIFLTADNDKKTLKTSFEVGGVDFITKPIIPTELYARVKTHLELSEYKNNLEKMVNYQTLIIKEKSQRLIEKLHYEENTGLKNMLSLQEEISNFDKGSLYLLDVDNFNIVNKLHGFKFGDKVLKKIGEKLVSIIPSELILYKIQSNRFVIMSHINDDDFIKDICDLIFKYFDMNDLVIDDINLKVSLSIGITQVNLKKETIIEAEYALDMAKRLGKRYRVIYNNDSNSIENEKENIHWLNKTRYYIDNNMIIPFFQPIIDVKNSQVYKYEALARVIDNDEIIPPFRFLESARKLGLLSSVTKAIIEKTCQQFANTQIKFSINITDRDLIEGYLNEYIKSNCEKYNINPQNITLELLENITLSDENEFITLNLKKIKEYGCKIAIDDFGSENSNFSRIISLKSDYLKIDGLFIKDIVNDEEKQKVTSAIIQLANKLGIKTVAEFVSNEEILNMVTSLGIDYVQGFYLGKPSPTIES